MIFQTEALARRCLSQQSLPKCLAMPRAIMFAGAPARASTYPVVDIFTPSRSPPKPVLPPGTPCVWGTVHLSTRPSTPGVWLGSMVGAGAPARARFGCGFLGLGHPCPSRAASGHVGSKVAGGVSSRRGLRSRLVGLRGLVMSRARSVCHEVSRESGKGLRTERRLVHRTALIVTQRWDLCLRILSMSLPRFSLSVKLVPTSYGGLSLCHGLRPRPFLNSMWNL